MINNIDSTTTTASPVLTLVPSLKDPVRKANEADAAVCSAAVRALSEGGASQENIDLLMTTLQFIVRRYNKILVDPEVMGSWEARAGWALFCARNAAVYLATHLKEVDVECRDEVIADVFLKCDDDPRVEEFWSDLAEHLFMWAREFPNPAWVAATPQLADPTLSMPVWMLPDGGVVCDLLVLAPHDDVDDEEEFLAERVTEAFEEASSLFGRGASAVRVVTVNSDRPTRLYCADGTYSVIDESVAMSGSL